MNGRDEGIRLRLFGYPEVWLDGRRVPLPIGKPLALLCYLAVCAPRAVPRQELCALLWEDAGPQHLRQALYILRRQLGEQLILQGSAHVQYAGELDLTRGDAVSDEVFLKGLEGIVAPRFQDWLAEQRRSRVSNELSDSSQVAPVPQALPETWLRWAQEIWESPDPEAIALLVFGDGVRALEVAERLSELPRQPVVPLPETVQQLLHARAARLLHQRSGDPARIAAHFLAARQPEQASPHLLASARRLLASKQPAQALRQALTALWASSHLPQRAEALFLLEELADQARQTDLQPRWLAELERLVFDSQSDDLLYRLALLQALRRRAVGRFDLASQAAGNALEIARRLGRPQQQHEASLLLGTLALLGGRLAEAQAVLHSVVRSSDSQLQLRARLNLGTVYALQGQRPAAVGHLERALTLARQVGDLKAVSVALNNLAGNYEGLARYADAAAMARSAYQLAGQHGQAAVRLTALLNMAEFHRSAGAYGPSWNTVQEALELVTPDTGAELHSALLSRLGMLERRFGRLKAAHTVLNRARTLADQVVGPRARLIAEMQLALLRLPGTRARAGLDEIAAQFRTHGYGLLADLTQLHAVYFDTQATADDLLSVSTTHRKHPHPHLAWLAALLAFQANGSGRGTVQRGLKRYQFAEAPEAWALLNDPVQAAALRLEQAAGLPSRQRRSFLAQPLS